MSAAQAIETARAAGIELSVDGNRLLIDAASEPPVNVIEELRRRKLEIVKLLRSEGRLPEIPEIPESPEVDRRDCRKAADAGMPYTEAIAALRVTANGFAARKVSGMYRPGEDIRVRLLGVDHAVEVKCRGDGFRELYAWLRNRDILIVKADRQEPLVVLRLSLAVEVAKATALRADL